MCEACDDYDTFDQDTRTLATDAYAGLKTAAAAKSDNEAMQIALVGAGISDQLILFMRENPAQCVPFIQLINSTLLAAITGDE